MLVEVLEGEDELGDVELGAGLVEPALLLQVPEELAAGHEVGDEVEVGRRLEGELEADDERRVGHGRAHEDVALAECVRDLLLLHDDFLGQNLHGVYPAGVFLADLVDLTERACR